MSIRFDEFDSTVTYRTASRSKRVHTDKALWKFMHDKSYTRLQRLSILRHVLPGVSLVELHEFLREIDSE